MLQDIQQVTSTQIARPDIFVERSLGHLADVNQGWVLAAQKRPGDPKFLFRDLFPRGFNLPFAGVALEDAALAAVSDDGVAVLRTCDVSDSIRSVMDQIGKAAWTVLIRFRSPRPADGEFLLLLPWLATNVSEAAAMAGCMQHLLKLALGEFDAVANRQEKEAEQRVYENLLADASNLPMPINCCIDEYTERLRAHLHSVTNEHQAVSNLLYGAREKAATWSCKETSEFVGELQGTLARFLERLDRIRKYWKKTGMAEPFDLLELLNEVCSDTPRRQQMIKIRRAESIASDGVQVQLGKDKAWILFDNHTQNAMRAIDQQKTSLLRRDLNPGADYDGAPGIDFFVDRVGNEAAVTMADSGCGMDPEVRSKLYQVVTTTKPAGMGGTGGILVRKYLDQMNGSIRIVQTAPGQGTTQEVRLPCLSV